MISEKLTEHLSEKFVTPYEKYDHESLIFYEIFQKTAPLFQHYSQYIKNYKQAREYKRELLQSNDKFSKFLDEVEYTPKLNG